MEADGEGGEEGVDAAEEEPKEKKELPESKLDKRVQVKLTSYGVLNSEMS